MALTDLDKTLLGRLADGRFHSGAELAETVGVTRATVWNRVRAMSETLGLDVTALPGRGYRLASPLELLCEDHIRSGLHREVAPLMGECHLFHEIGSTNSHLLEMAAAQGIPEGTVCLAERQRAGRGRMGREWISPFGSNIYLSVFWRFDEPSQLAGLSLAVGVAVIRALEANGCPGVRLKWPNDILWEFAKLGGILIEVAGEAHGSCTAVIGLGLNRVLPDAAASGIDQPWTDLGRATGRMPPPRNQLIAALLNELLPMLKGYPAKGLARYLPEWRRAHACQGQMATLHFGESAVEGRIVDVTDEGLLVLECGGAGQHRTFASGDVRLRVKMP